MCLKTKKLSTSFLYPVLLAVFIIMTLFTSYEVYQERNRLLDEMDNKADTLLGITSAAASDAFWSYNESSLKNIGDILDSYQEVAQIKLLDDSREVIYENVKQAHAYRNEYLRPAYTRQIFRNDTLIGEIELVFTNYYLNQAITSAIGFGILKAVIIMLVIIVVILALTRNVANAIDRVEEGVNAFTDGDNKVRIFLKNQYEINKLASRINILFDTIVNASKKLSDHNEALRISEDKLRITEERYRFAVEGSNDAIWDWNLSSGEFYVSVRGAQMAGFSGKDIDSLDIWMSCIHPQDIEQFEHFLQGFKLKPESYDQIKYRVLGRSGETRWLFCRGKGILDQDRRLIRVSGFCTDITERILADESINRLAYYDTLTGLPNRARLMEYLDDIMNDQAKKCSSLALLYLDLDNFKAINDTKGHVTGDKLLVSISAEFANGIACDFIARIGGDEFVFIKKECEAIDAGRIASRIIDIIRKPWIVDEGEFNLTCSIGITMYPENGTNTDTLLMNADNAMYQSKDQGRDQYKFFEPAMNERIAQKIQMQNEMRKGLANNEFNLYYQPQVEVATGKTIGVEALVRWQHPVRGLVFPLDFIGAAEENGFIIPLGEYILRSACRQSAKWEEAGFHGITVSVNFSQKQFNKNTLVDDVMAILKETGMRPELLDIEITESMAMENIENTLQKIHKLKEIGVCFSLDDFGSGFSSLNYLKILPIDHLKIDKQFIHNVMKDNFEGVVVEAIIHIAHSMNLIVIAEGIEQQEQHETLGKLNCDQAQGYLYSRPVPAEEIPKLLQKRLML